MSNARTLGPLSGVLFAVLFVVTVFFVGDTGDDGADSAGILADRPDTFMFAFLTGALSTVALLGFFAWLRELVREVGLPRPLLATLTIAPVAAAAPLICGSLAIMSGAAEAADSGETSPEVVAFAMNAQYFFLVGGFMLAGLAVVCASLGLRRTGALPDGLCAAGVVVGLLQLGAFTVVPIMLLVLWVLVSGIVLLTRRSHTAAGAAGQLSRA